VIIGWYPEEQQQAQEIRLDVTIHFQNNAAIHSDDLAHTVCYAELITNLKNTLSLQPFKLIEHACYACYQQIKTYADYPVSVTLTKLRMPIEYLHGGASYTCSDF
jgi:FolB domain-containing protein